MRRNSIEEVRSDNMKKISCRAETHERSRGLSLAGPCVHVVQPTERCSVSWEEALGGSNRVVVTGMGVDGQAGKGTIAM